MYAANNSSSMAPVVSSSVLISMETNITRKRMPKSVRYYPPPHFECCCCITAITSLSPRSTLSTDSRHLASAILYFAGRNRWVVYADAQDWRSQDPSVIPPEWHGWLHAITDENPTNVWLCQKDMCQSNTILSFV